VGSRRTWRSRGPRRLRRRLVRGVAWAAIVAVAASFLPLAALRWIDPPTSAFMLRYRLGGETGALRPLAWRWVDLERMSPHLPLAIVAAEDQRFPYHAGFDVDAMAEALREHREGRRLRGASTLSQQVAKNLFLWPGHSWLRKGLEAWIVGWLELLWPKRRILEVHLNLAEFGPGVFGVEAASERFFGKPAARIGRTEAALLAAVLPNPARLHADAPSAFVRERATWIEAQMRRLGPAYLAGL
jgi:monofunctional biosynthetic peptidoglycan transglycosylase